MVRIILTYVLPLLLPTIMYFAWVSWVRKQVAAKKAQAAAEGTEAPSTEDMVHDLDIKTPWFRLALAGTGLLIVASVLSVLLVPENPENSTYQPPRLEDGKVVPGQFTPKPDGQ